MFPSVFFFLFKTLLIPCDTKVLITAIPKLGIIFLAIGLKKRNKCFRNIS